MPNYTLGRGKLYLSRFSSGIVPLGFRYIGNTPEISLTIDRETLDHFNSDAGVREKDASVTLETNRTMAFTTDEIDAENIALFFFGSASALTIAGAVGQNWTFTVRKGFYYQVGQSAANPQGVRNLANVVVQVGVSVKVLNTDYTLDLVTGRIYIIPGGTIADNALLDVDYDQVAGTGARVISGSDPVPCAFQYVSENPAGTDRDMFIPSATIAPNGDYALKGDEWQAIPFSVDILKPDLSEAIIWEDRHV